MKASLARLTLADRIMNDIRIEMDLLDKALEIDQYKQIFQSTKRIRQLLQELEDPAIDFLTMEIPKPSGNDGL